MKDGKITVGQNASKDLRRMAGLVSTSGSATALSLFTKTAANDTKVNFSIVTEKVDNGLGGLHQAHDKDGKALTWVANNDGTGHFNGQVAFIKDEKGNLEYKEATITVYEGNIKGDSQQATDDTMVSVMSHEEEHDNDKDSMNAIKDRQEGRKNDFDVEAPAYRVGAQVDREIKENRQKKPKPND